MKLNNLCDLEGAFKSKKRVGRGLGSGKGKTCGRGVKGQKSRSGVSINGFEGGQMPIYRRLPKRGFTNVFAKTYSIISLSAIQHAIDSGKLNPSEKLTQSLFLEAGLINKLCDGVKILADGELKAKIAVEVAKASKAAIEKVEKLGGTISFLTKTQEV